MPVNTTPPPDHQREHAKAGTPLHFDRPAHSSLCFYPSTGQRQGISGSFRQYNSTVMGFGWGACNYSTYFVEVAIVGLRWPPATTAPVIAVEHRDCDDGKSSIVSVYHAERLEPTQKAWSGTPDDPRSRSPWLKRNRPASHLPPPVP